MFEVSLLKLYGIELSSVVVFGVGDVGAFGVGDVG